MKWKEFFKPTKAKIILFIIISLVFIPFIEYHNRCEIPPCGVTLRPLSIHLIKDINIEGINYPTLVIGLILSYLASCLLILVYNKFKK